MDFTFYIFVWISMCSLCLFCSCLWFVAEIGLFVLFPYKPQKVLLTTVIFIALVIIETCFPANVFFLFLCTKSLLFFMILSPWHMTATPSWLTFHLCSHQNPVCLCAWLVAFSTTRHCFIPSVLTACSKLMLSGGQLLSSSLTSSRVLLNTTGFSSMFKALGLSSHSKGNKNEQIDKYMS